MELSQVEVNRIETAIEENGQVRELSDLQLAVIGGGCGETIAI